MDTLQRQLQRAVQGRKITVTVLAEACGVTRQTVYSWLRGARPKLDRRLRLLQLLEYLDKDQALEERLVLLGALQQLGAQLPTRWLRMLVNVARELAEG